MSKVFALLVGLAIVSLACAKYQSGKRMSEHCQSLRLQGEKNSGEFDLKLPNITLPIRVHCNFTSGNSFVVIQRRQYGTVDFNRTYQDYQWGFGNAQGDYWAGLDTISHLTNTGYNFLHIDMADWSPTPQKAFAQYKQFTVMNAANYYRMTVGAYAAGNVPDDLSYNSNNYFFTPDRPDTNNCAPNFGAGWWFYYCSYANPNGKYYPNGPYPPNRHGFYDGIYWKDWAGFGYSMKFFSMTLYYGM